MNAIQVIKPYKQNGIWMFDDAAKGLLGEAFVAGADNFIEQLADTVGRVKSRSGFNLVFSEHPFPEHQLQLEHDGPGEMKCGDYYIHKPTKQRVWLCPALLLYFKKAPAHIYAQAKPISPA